MSLPFGSSFHICTVANIPIKIHWSFGLLLLFVFYVVRQNELLSADIVWFFLLILIMFLFVIMHEFGHAIMARQFGVKTRDIIISPIGGVARLESIPKIPKHELFIAIAGPAVNLILVLFFFILQLSLGFDLFPQSERINPIIAPDAFLAYLFSINIALIVFNMIPAFPMDGGRVLRSILSMILKNHLNATKWASYIGQLFALVFVVAGAYFDHYVLLFVGIFVFVTARAEYRQALTEYKMTYTKVIDILRRDFAKLSPFETLSRTMNYPEQGSFLVLNDLGSIIGALPELFIKDLIKQNKGDMLVQDVMSQSYGYISEQMTAATAFQALNEYGWSIAVVIDDSKNIKGVLDRRILLDFLNKKV